MTVDIDQQLGWHFCCVDVIRKVCSDADCLRIDSPTSGKTYHECRGLNDFQPEFIARNDDFIDFLDLTVNSDNELSSIKLTFRKNCFLDSLVYIFNG